MILAHPHATPTPEDPVLAIVLIALVVIAAALWALRAK